MERSRRCTFIEKLFIMFNDCSLKKKSWSCIYGWFNDDSIVIFDPSLFLSICCKDIFRFTKIESFYRQLHLYGFKRLSDHNPKIVYKNIKFFKNMKLNDILNITRVSIIKKKALIKLSNNSNDCKRKLNVNDEIKTRSMKYIRSSESSDVEKEDNIESNYNKKECPDSNDLDFVDDIFSYFEKNNTYFDEFNKQVNSNDNLYHDSSKDSYLREVNTILSLPYFDFEKYDIN